MKEGDSDVLTHSWLHFADGKGGHTVRKGWKAPLVIFCISTALYIICFLRGNSVAAQNYDVTLLLYSKVLLLPIAFFSFGWLISSFIRIPTGKKGSLAIFWPCCIILGAYFVIAVLYLLNVTAPRIDFFIKNPWIFLLFGGGISFSATNMMKKEDIGA